MGVAPFAGSGYNQEYRAIRTSQYTYVRGLQGPWLLFDDEKDPYQLRNLAAVPEYAALCRQLDDRLQSALRKIGDPFRPAAYYIKRWGLKVAPGDSISYAPGAQPQTPQRNNNLTTVKHGTEDVGVYAPAARQRLDGTIFGPVCPAPPRIETCLSSCRPRSAWLVTAVGWRSA